jgi:hypothetical protein
MKTTICALSIVLLLVPGCVKRPAQTDPAALTSEARELLNAMSDSLRINGLTGWLPFLHKSPQFAWEFNGVSTSYDSLIAAERQQASFFRTITMVWDSVNAVPVGENAMHLSAKFSETLVMASGGEMTVRGWVDGELERIDGAWKFTRGRTFDH